MALTEIIFGGAGGAPSDAYSPANKPRLNAVGTADYVTLTPTTGGNNIINYRFGGPRYDLAQTRIYSRIVVPLRNVVGGEVLRLLIARKDGSTYTLVYALTEALTAGQTEAEFQGPFELTPGTWGVAFGMTTGGGFADQLNRFYGANENYPAPHVGGLVVQTDTPVSIGVGNSVDFGESSGGYRSISMYGVQQPKGVAGHADAADVTFSGTTAQRPTAPVTGQAYFDTTLGYEINWSGSSWVNSVGVAV